MALIGTQCDFSVTHLLTILFINDRFGQSGIMDDEIRPEDGWFTSI